MHATRLLPAVLVGAGLWLGSGVALDATGDDVGTVRAAVDGGLSSLLADVRPGAADEGGHAPVATPAGDVARRPARLAELDLATTTPPTRLDLPALGVGAEVVPVGVDDDGLMTVPEDVTTVGWYQHGPGPGTSAGSVVLAGHVDSRTQGRGAFFALADAAVGDVVTVADATGAETLWRVVGRRTYTKASLPVDDLYARTGPPRLVLITCGGDFDADTSHYEANVVVEAELLA